TRTNVVRLPDDVVNARCQTVLTDGTGEPSGPSFLGYSAERQGDYVASACRAAHQLDGVTGIGIWRYIDTAWRSFPPQENHFGLFDNKGSLKPAWTEFSKVIKELKS